MLIDEYVDEVSFRVGLLNSDNVEGIDINRSVLSAFRELKKYMKGPAYKTVPYSTRLDLVALGIDTNLVMNVKPARPRLGLSLGSIDSGNVFQLAASVNSQNMIGNTSRLNLDPVISELAMAQVRNTLSTDFQFRYDKLNQVIYCTHKDPKPAQVTIVYKPKFTDVSEIDSDEWQDYLIRLATARTKIVLGRVRSKYRVEGSNVSNDGELMLSEGNAELDKLMEELESHRRKLIVVN